MSYNLLIVDDSSIIRKSIKKTLALTDVDLGEIIEAENGQVALDKLKDNWVDLIFLDINMPVMNGIEFVEALRKDNELKNTPVVIISTEGSQERIQRLMELEVKDYLRKPVTPEAVCESIESILGDK